LSLSNPLTFHEKATHASFVPTQLFRYLKGECLGANSLKALLVGGASTNESLVQECKERDLPLYLTYGMTEMGSQITCGLYANGKVLPYRDLMIDSTGEIKVKGKSLFSGYLREDGTTHLPLDEKGYFSTRDIGSYDEEKGLVLVGRKDRQFISGGENIQPEEIEKMMKSLFSLSYCKVTPEPSLDGRNRTAGTFSLSDTF
jgi:O-succinylbenzoic acid--CoA ligase